MNKNWKATDFLEALDATYKDIDTYFLADNPFLEQADNMYNAISLISLDLPITTKQMLEKG
jgi:hypothetical protein